MLSPRLSLSNRHPQIHYLILPQNHRLRLIWFLMLIDAVSIGFPMQLPLLLQFLTTLVPAAGDSSGRPPLPSLTSISPNLHALSLSKELKIISLSPLFSTLPLLPLYIRQAIVGIHHPIISLSLALSSSLLTTMNKQQPHRPDTAAVGTACHRFTSLSYRTKSRQQPYRVPPRQCRPSLHCLTPFPQRKKRKSKQSENLSHIQRIRRNKHNDSEKIIFPLRLFFKNLYFYSNIHSK